MIISQKTKARPGVFFDFLIAGFFIMVSMSKFYYSPALCGAGKTHQICERAARDATKNDRHVLIVQPTIELINQTEAKLRSLCPGLCITAIWGDGSTERLVNHFRNAKMDGPGEIVLCTHAALIKTPYFHRADRWHLYLDEVPDAVVYDAINIPDHHKIITDYVATAKDDAIADYAELLASDRAKIKAIAENPDRDEVSQIFQPLAQKLINKNWKTYVKADNFHRLVSNKTGPGGDNEARQLQTFSILQTDVLSDFGFVLIAGANFEQSALYYLWGPHRFELAKNFARGLRYTSHDNGDRLTLYYVFDDVDGRYSKRMRDADVGDGKSIGDHMREGVQKLFGSVDPVAYLANKDQPDMQIGPNEIRLPNKSHGLNQFQHLHNFACLSALNPTTPLAKFLQFRGMTGAETQLAIQGDAIYQALMRISLRDPEATDPVRAVIPDRIIAEHIASLFPGAKIEPLEWAGKGNIKPRRVGQPKKHTNEIEKISRYRDEISTDWWAALCEIGSDIDKWQAHLQVENERFLCNDIPYTKGISLHIFSCKSGLYFPIYTSKNDAEPHTHQPYDSHDEFVDWLHELHANTKPDKKTDVELISASFFLPREGETTSRGLANIVYTNGLWFDFEKGDLKPEEFADLFPDLRIVTWNTYSATSTNNRWRAFIPTTQPMARAIHDAIMGQIIKALNRNGYWSQRQLDANPRIKKRRLHGIDESKLTPSSLFYLPAQASVRSASFFVDYNSRGPLDVDHTSIKRGPLDVIAWMEHAISVMRPNPEPEEPNPTISASPIILSSNTDLAKVQRLLQDKLDYRKARIEKAIDDYAGHGAGEGNLALFKLAMRLNDLGLPTGEIEDILRANYHLGRSISADRRKEIPALIKKIARGKFVGRIRKPRV